MRIFELLFFRDKHRSAGYPLPTRRNTLVGSTSRVERSKYCETWRWAH